MMTRCRWKASQVRRARTRRSWVYLNWSILVPNQSILKSFCLHLQRINKNLSQIWVILLWRISTRKMSQGKHLKRVQNQSLDLKGSCNKVAAVIIVQDLLQIMERTRPKNYFTKATITRKTQRITSSIKRCTLSRIKLRIWRKIETS